MPTLTLKAWRNARGFTQKEMADTCGVHENTYRQWEEKPSVVSLANAYKLAEKLSVTIDDIFFGCEVNKMTTQNEEG